jgi:hypothetical protein
VGASLLPAIDPKRPLSADPPHQPPHRRRYSSLVWSSDKYEAHLEGLIFEVGKFYKRKGLFQAFFKNHRRVRRALKTIIRHAMQSRGCLAAGDLNVTPDASWRCSRRRATAADDEFEAITGGGEAGDGTSMVGIVDLGPAAPTANSLWLAASPEDALKRCTPKMSGATPPLAAPELALELPAALPAAPAKAPATAAPTAAPPSPPPTPPPSPLPTPSPSQPPLTSGQSNSSMRYFHMVNLHVERSFTASVDDLNATTGLERLNTAIAARRWVRP